MSVIRYQVVGTVIIINLLLWESIALTQCTTNCQGVVVVVSLDQEMETSSIWEEHLKSFGTIFFLEWTYFTPVFVRREQRNRRISPSCTLTIFWNCQFTAWVKDSREAQIFFWSYVISAEATIWQPRSCQWEFKLRYERALGLAVFWRGFHLKFNTGRKLFLPDRARAKPKSRIWWPWILTTRYGVESLPDSASRSVSTYSAEVSYHDRHLAGSWNIVGWISLPI